MLGVQQTVQIYTGHWQHVVLLFPVERLTGLSISCHQERKQVTTVCPRSRGALGASLMVGLLQANYFG
jgi:hypothetical protein